MDLVVHRLVQAHRVGVAQTRVHRDGRPLLAAVRSRQHEHAVGRRLRVHVLLRHERRGATDQLAGGGVEHVHEAGLARFHHGLLPTHHGDHRWAHRVQVPHVVRHFLISPLELAVGRVDRDDRFGPAVVARADRPVQIGRRVADRDEQGLAGLVVGGRHPHRAAARLPGVGVLGGVGMLLRDVTLQVVTLGRGLGEGAPPAPLLRRGQRVPRPHRRAARCAERLHVAADTILRAGRPDDHVVADHERRHRLRVARRRAITHLDLPLHLAARRVERHQVVVERAHEHRPAGHGYATVVGSAARCGNGVVLVRVLPQHLLRPQVEGAHDVVRRRRRRDVHGPVDDDRRGLEAAQRGRAVRVHRPRDQTLDVQCIDRLEGGEAVVPVVVPVHQPITARRGVAQHVVRHDRGGRGRDARIRDSSRPLPAERCRDERRDQCRRGPSSPMHHTHLR